MAEKYFGDAPAIGKVMTINNEIDYKVVGVFKELPAQHPPRPQTSLRCSIPSGTSSGPGSQSDGPRPTCTPTSSFARRESMARVESDLRAFVDRNVVSPDPRVRECSHQRDAHFRPDALARHPPARQKNGLLQGGWRHHHGHHLLGHCRAHSYSSLASTSSTSPPRDRCSARGRWRCARLLAPPASSSSANSSAKPSSPR